MIRNFYITYGLTLALSLLIVFSFGACGGKGKDTPPNKTSLTPEQKQAIARADELIERGYTLKKTGHNRAALNLFEQAGTILSQSAGKKSEQYASVLDDQATVLLRTGDYQKSRAFYNKAATILAEGGQSKGRLAEGIERRLKILDTLEKLGILCNEHLAPPEPGDAGDAGISPPYFPNLEEVHGVFAKINQHLGGCADRPIGSTPIRVVLTGDGRLIIAQARGNLGLTPQGECLEEKILTAAKQYVDAFPRFKACFRNFTFPFVPN